MILADFNPSILFLLLWGLLSWLTNKKKKDAKNKQPDVNPPIQKKKEDIFERLRILQEHLASEVELFPSEPEEDNFIETEVDEEPEFEEPLTEIENETDYPFPEGKLTDLEAAPVESSERKRESTWVPQVLLQRNELKKAIILKEILDQPRSLRPF